MNDGGGGAGDGRFDEVCYCWSFGKPNVLLSPKLLNWWKEERRRLVVTSA